MPAGSLYRHVALLTKAGVLQVVAGRRVRGAIERTCTLRLLAAQIQPGEAAAMTLDEHAQAFMAYVAGLLADFGRYLATGPADPVRDGAGYRAGALWLTDAEFTDLRRDLVAVFQPRLANAPGGGAGGAWSTASSCHRPSRTTVVTDRSSGREPGMKRSVAGLGGERAGYADAGVPRW